MNKIWLMHLLVVMCVGVVNSARLLAMLTTPLASHKNAFGSILQTLASEHNISYYGLSLKVNHPNITQKHVNIETFQDSLGSNLFSRNGIPPPHLFVMNFINGLPSSFYEAWFHGKDIEELLDPNSNEKFDALVVLCISAEPFMLFAEKFDIPIILVCPSLLNVWNNMQIGNPNFLSTDISFVSPDSSNTFFGRLSKFIKHVQVLYHYLYTYLPRMDEISLKHFPEGTRAIFHTFPRVQLILVNTNSVMGYGRPSISNIVEIGGLHCRPAKPLAADLQHYLEDTKATTNGVIYFSLGGTLHGSQLPKESLRIFLGAFRRLKQKVLWKMEKVIDDLPENVKISQWFSQQDILGHRNVKLFITQGGMLSFQEASYHGVPVLVIPLIVDQFTNADVAEKNKYGLQLRLAELTEDKLVQSINELMNNTLYHENAKLISTAIKQQDHKPSETLLFWTRLMLENKNIPLLHAPCRNLTWYQMFHMDIFLFVIVLTVVLLVILCSLVTYIVKQSKLASSKQKTM